MESSASNSCQRPDSRASLSSNNETPLTNIFPGWVELPDEVVERCESSEATLHIDLSAIPKQFQAKAKKQVLGNCYVKICDLAILVNSSKDTNERKAVKRPRDDSLSRNNERFTTARISTQGQHWKLPKKKYKALQNPENYNVRNVSETRLVVQKRSFEYVLPQCTPIRPELEYEDTDTDPLPGPSHNYHNHYVTSSAPTVSFPRKCRPILQKALEVHGESVIQPELNTKSKSIDHSKRCVNVGTQTEPQPQIEFLQRRISELELIIATNRSFQTPSPLLQKNQDDAASALSTPPNSDSGSCNGRIEKISESSSSKRNSTPTKSALIVVSRLTDNDLRQYGVSRNSSVSPTEETRPKKRPRLSSFSDFERRSSKKPEKRINGTKEKVSHLFGDDSDEDVASHPKKVLEKPQPLDMDELNYDFDEEEVESRRLSVDKQKKSNETNHREKSSKSDKKEKNSEKDRRKEKERKKKDSEKTKAGEHSKSSKEKSAKESSKSGKNPTVAGNAVKYKIPKKPAPTSAGLPPFVQQALDAFMKGPAPSSGQQTVSSGTPEPVLPKNTVVKPNDLANVSSTSKNAVEQPVAPESFELSCKTAPTILCNPRESVKGRITKSVNFPEENLESVRTISPRFNLQQAERAIEVSSVREKYIPLIINDLTYEPKSSPREPVKGIRPFHPPNRRIGDDKLTLIQERGGRRFFASSSSSSSDSESETSANESSEKINTNKHSGETISAIFPSNDLCLSVENQSITNGYSVIPEESSGDPTAQEMEETTTPLSSTVSDELCTPNSAVEPVSMINAAATRDSTKEGSSPVVPEEHTQAIAPKKLPIPSLAVPPSPRRQTPEPIYQVSSILVNVKSSIPMENDSEEDDVLDIGLNESFGYEEEELPPPKLPSNMINNAPAKIVFDRPSPTKIVASLNKANVPAVPAKPAVIQRTVISNVANPPYPQDDVASNRGLCFDFVRSGVCKVSDTPAKKCDFSHDLDSALDNVNYLCNKKCNIQLAYRLVCCMTNIDSPLNKSLYEPLGVNIVRTIIKAIVMGNRQEFMSIALEMLCDRKLPLIPEFVDAVIKQTPVSSASVNHLVSLYERCQFVDSYKMSLFSLYKVTAVLVDHWESLKKWEFIYSVVELAISNYPQSYRPSYEVLYFIFGEAHDQLRLERLCRLFNGIEPPVIALLGQEKRREILNRLRNFGMVHWYDRYAGIRRSVEGEMHVMPTSIRPTQSQFIGPQQYPPNGIISHPPRGPVQPLHRAQHPNVPLAHQMQPPLRQPNYGSQFPLMPPVGLQRPPVPSFPSSSLYRPQPPIVQSVGVHHPQPPTVPAVGVHRPQPPTVPMGHPVVSVLHPQTPPSVPNSIRDPREKVSRPMPYENGIDPVPSSSISLAASNPAPPTNEAYPVETKKTTPIIALEVPKPTHSLDLNLFEPESPEVEPVFLEENEEEQAPRVVVELSHAGEDELLTEFNKQNFKAVTSWYLQHYTGDRKCRMLAKLVHLIKTNPIYDGDGSNQAMSPGHIAFKILHTAFVDEEGNPTVLEPRQRQALFDLIFFVLYNFLEMSMTDDEDEKMAQEQLAKNFLELLMVFQEQVPLENFIKHPGLLQFVAKCSLEVYWSKEEDEEDFLGVVVPHIERAIMLLTEFHKIIKKIPSNVNSDLVRQDMELADHLLQTLGDFNQLEGASSFSAGIAGCYDDYNNAALCNKSLFQALLPSGS